MKQLISLIFIFVIPVFCQDVKQHPFSGTLVLSLEGGFTLGKTDYSGSPLGGRLTGGIEYYLPASSNHIFGIRGFAGGQQINSSDDNKTVSIQGEVVLLPDEIINEMYIAGLALSYSYSFKDTYFPFISLGLSNLWFSPKMEDGRRAPRNMNNLYDRNAISYDISLGLKYEVAENWSVKIESGFHFPSTDNLDDITVGEFNDFYATVIAGVSYSLFANKDTDGDGIPDNIDKCIDAPEDYDGFEDDDGCPDPDNDNDGIPDILDKCPDNAEDYDGFMDNDGCPDIDNDGDGIIDEKDECPNEAEDFDGFEDDDGCPDLDNDEDGINDVDDDCPNEPGSVELKGCPGEGEIETQNNYIGAPKEIIIEGEATFYPGKSEIKPEAYPELDRIVKILQLYPEINWRIEGHSDTDESQNLMIRPLSLRRAEAILNYFIAKGLPSFQFKIYDMGDKFPIANNNTEYGRMKNRRVVIVREN